ncbi:hypothetical protein METBIDRAFT_11267 [Metschnikowia bicuspidata var. bicuspidata NRRL YB-4993]|uniref:Uncharacterized protein n=1 Tax=Metschnikowia bicuspidata var. bicuspidata NRRL YB-4993 TaxID=869754 RepID=A0A1A0HEW7_9ASCO|nr:hypothetical protein METBIDRAFT_11267 [Metschnikowia bicuspidata var. bicuspidata NRRL YB-4993]OBA22432.1 hypothetical protein METBIDRAFT_11267 [Metschnikowia bicuspidata var. bicuspidata NRRL YB-4993]
MANTKAPPIQGFLPGLELTPYSEYGILLSIQKKDIKRYFKEKGTRLQNKCKKHCGLLIRLQKYTRYEQANMIPKELISLAKELSFTSQFQPGDEMEKAKEFLLQKLSLLAADCIASEKEILAANIDPKKECVEWFNTFTSDGGHQGWSTYEEIHAACAKFDLERTPKSFLDSSSIFRKETYHEIVGKMIIKAKEDDQKTMEFLAKQQVNEDLDDYDVIGPEISTRSLQKEIESLKSAVNELIMADQVKSTTQADQKKKKSQTSVPKKTPNKKQNQKS